MKKLNLHHIANGFRLALATLLISVVGTSCEQENLVQSDKQPLSFVTLSKNIKPSSRAAYTGVFGTTIYYADNITDITKDNKADKVWDNIINASVSYKNGVWATETEKYSPTGGGILAVAYSPYSNVGTNGVQMPYNMNTPYIYGTTKNNQTDLLFADVQWLPVATSHSSPVPVKFNHALAMVTVKVKLATSSVGDDSWKLTLKTAELLNINDEGMVIINNNGNNGWSTNNEGAWNFEKEIYQTFTNTGNRLLSTTAVTVFENKIVIPQKLREKSEANHQTLRLTYDLETTRKYKDKDGNEIIDVSTQELVKDIALKTQDISTWEMGKHITYNISFNSGVAIEFDGSANAWGDEVVIGGDINQ